MRTQAFARRVLGESRIAVCVGCGGVGKTTVAAALGLEAARGGRRALVLTIDPARRLADALGVELGSEPRTLPRPLLERHGVPAEGSLAAVMLDMKSTFDGLVGRFAENAEARERVMRNPIYQHVSDALAGSVEYSAMEKVYELSQREDVDLVVVDTPPSQHALDFLDAPQRLTEFLDSRIVQMLIHPAFSAGRFGFRVFQRTAHRVLQVMERVTGLGFLEDVSEFLLAFEAMAEGFRRRAGEVRRLLLGDEASFVLVTGPAPESVRQAEQFLDRLETHSVPLAGVLVNRTHLWPGAGQPGAAPEEKDLPALARALAAADGDAELAREAARAALETAKRYAAWVRRDAEAVRGLRRRARARGCFWAEIPELPEDVHDLDGLARVSDWILRGGPRPSGD